MIINCKDKRIHSKFRNTTDYFFFGADGGVGGLAEAAREARVELEAVFGFGLGDEMFFALVIEFGFGFEAGFDPDGFWFAPWLLFFLAS